ncbi:MAG: N-acyl-L-amino acid amidohydrolase [Bacteroidetes bacterium]|jgi:amidohydrolase|nr:N-acyl-L-amino acid amidohydrolase [Bacteroidota bacterium]
MITVDRIKQLAQDYFDEVVSYRRQLHMHPELSFQEFETSTYVSSVLKRYNISHTTGIVQTGIVAIVEGKNPGKKIILLRADLDALPIEENNKVDYKSRNHGIMHACGHDVHTASVLGTAIILNQLKEEFEGTIKIMFQPGEEVLPGGSSLMIKAGVLDNPRVDIALAQHVFPSMETGKVGFREGMYMASTDELHITITGKGGHAAMAGDYKNPLVVAAHIITEIEKQFPFTIDSEGVARNTQNNIPTVIAFGKIEGKGATNVIPETVYLAGTFRTMDEDWRKEVKEKITTIIKTISDKYQVKAEINILDGYPFLVNDHHITQQCKQAATEYLGNENVEDLPLRMTAEDFAYITQQVPSCFYRLGTGNKVKGIVSGVHTSTFDIDEKALEISTGLMAWMTLKTLQA